MAVLPLVKYPDIRLRSLCAPVTEFNDELVLLVENLRDTMRAAPGVGITAAHVGIMLRVVVLDVFPDQGVRSFINPEVIWASDAMMRHEEGSVSMPGVVEEIERASAVRIRYQDVAGVEHIEDVSGFAAICHQHEIDQLDGIFWIQRLSRLKRDRVIKRYEKLNR